MALELEDRLERVAERLAPTSASRERARSAALAALQQAPRRRPRRGLPVLSAVAAVVIVIVGILALLAAPWRESPLTTERALAALGHHPVVHAIVEQPRPRASVIELATGRERPEAHRSEYWYDDERDLLRVRLSVGGVPLPGGEYLHSPEGFFTDRGVQREQIRPPRLDPALGRFASGYKEALDNGEATVVGEEVVDGREAVILRFPEDQVSQDVRVAAYDVAVDADEFRPFRFRLSSNPDGSPPSPWSEAPRVIEIETIPRDPSDFEPPHAGKPRPAGQTGVEERTLDPADAAAALGRPAFWPGRAIEGAELTQIELMRLTTRWTDGRTSEGHALVFQYGVDRRTAHLEGKPSLIVTESSSAEETPRFDFGGAMPEPGELRLTGFGNAGAVDAEMWFGSMQRDGMYISLESPQRSLIVSAAKAMIPLD